MCWPLHFIPTMRCLHQDIPQQHHPLAILAATRADRRFWFCRHTPVPGSCEQAAAASPAPPAGLLRPPAPLQLISHMDSQRQLTATPRTPLHILVFVTLMHSQGSAPFTHTCPPTYPLAWKTISCSHSAVFWRTCARGLPGNYHQMLGAAMARHTDTTTVISTQQTAPPFHLLHPHLPPSPDTRLLALRSGIHRHGSVQPQVSTARC